MMIKMTTALAASVTMSAAALAADVAAARGVTIEPLGRLDLAKEEIGVSGGDFRASRATLNPDAVTNVRNAEGDVALIYVVQGVVMLDGDELPAGTLARLEHEHTADLANAGDSRAVIVIMDVVGAQP